MWPSHGKRIRAGFRATLRVQPSREQKIEALKINKSIMPQEQYDKEMEDLLVQLATKNQQIKAQEPKKP